jgi:hypothetical protein
MKPWYEIPVRVFLGLFLLAFAAGMAYVFWCVIINPVLQGLKQLFGM